MISFLTFASLDVQYTDIFSRHGWVFRIVFIGVGHNDYTDFTDTWVVIRMPKCKCQPWPN